MAEYASLKVPELKKLLGERSLVTTGNKADLVARLQESDKSAPPTTAPVAEDEIDFSDDDVDGETAEKPVEPAIVAPAADKGFTAKTPSAKAPASKAPANKASSKAAAEPTAASTATTKAVKSTAAPDGEVSSAATPGVATEATAVSAPEDFALHLPATAGNEEARKRTERAKRFGVVEDDDAKKRLDRGKKFGLDQTALAGLDEALPEKPRKRGRERDVDAEDNSDANGRSAKRQSMDRPGRPPADSEKRASAARNGDLRNGESRNGEPRYGEPRNSRNSRAHQSALNGGGGGGRGGRRGDAATKKDPSENAKLNARRKRFAAK